MAKTRDELYQEFGPKLLEAVVLLVRDEINILRTAASLPERTNEQIRAGLEAKLNSITNYDWMRG